MVCFLGTFSTPPHPLPQSRFLLEIQTFDISPKGGLPEGLDVAFEVLKVQNKLADVFNLSPILELNDKLDLDSVFVQTL